MSGAKVASSLEHIERLHKRLQPVYLIYKMTGMLPLKISSTLTPRRSDIYYTLFFIAAYGVLCVYSSATFPAQPTRVSEPRYLVVLWATIIVGCQMLMLLFAFRYRGALVTGLNNLARINFLLQQLRIPIEHSYSASLRVVTFLLVSVTTRVVVLMQIVDVNVPQMITAFMATMAKSMCKYQFAMLIAPVMLRFRKINAELAKLMHAGRKDDGAEVARRTRLQQLTRAHFKLCNVCKNIHDALSFTLLLSMIQTATDIFQHTFYLYLALTKSCVDCGVLHYLCPVLWLLGESIETINLVRTCENATAEANKIGPLLHKLRRFVGDACARDIYSYSVECLHQHVKFDMAGFVVLDYNILYMFVQVFSTYFIISIQFFETHLSDKQSNATYKHGG